jgi:hypothetical protein
LEHIQLELFVFGALAFGRSNPRVLSGVILGAERSDYQICGDGWNDLGVVNWGYNDTIPGCLDRRIVFKFANGGNPSLSKVTYLTRVECIMLRQFFLQKDGDRWPRYPGAFTISDLKWITGWSNLFAQVTGAPSVDYGLLSPPSQANGLLVLP